MNITNVTSDNFINKFENAKYLISEAIPNCNIPAFQKEWQQQIKENKAVIFSAEEADKIIGIFMGVVNFNSCTNERILTECHWYVLPNHRHTAGVELYKSVLEHAKKDFCNAVIFTSMNNKMLDNFYLTNGFIETGKIFKKEI
jgi:L-amino acid N-acyltransferase YncA